MDQDIRQRPVSHLPLLWPSALPIGRPRTGRYRRCQMTRREVSAIGISGHSRTPTNARFHG